MRFALVTSLCFAALIGCSGNESEVATATANTPLVSATDDLGALVPADALVFLYIPVPGDLDKAVGSLVGAVNPGMAGKVNALEAFAAAGIDKQSIDMSRPMAVAVSLPQEGPPQPMPTFIIPVKDASAVLAAREGKPGTALAAGNYVGVSFHPTYAAGTATPAIAKNLAAGHVCARIDVKGLVARFGPMLDRFTKPGELELMDPSLFAAPNTAETLGAMMTGARKFLDSLDSVQASVTLDDGMVDVRVEMTMIAGSGFELAASSGGLNEAAKSLAAHDAGIVFLARANWSSMMDLIEPLLRALVEAMPPEQKQGMEHYIAKSRELYETMGDTMAFAGDLTSDGMVMTGYASCKDAQQYLTSYRELIESPMLKNFGYESISVEPETVGGVEMQRFTMKFNMTQLLNRSGGEDLSPEALEEAKAMTENMMKAIFGAEGFQFRLGAVGDDVVFSMGGGTVATVRAIEAAKTKNGSLPPAAQAALDRMQGNASFLMYADCRQFLRWSMDLARTTRPELPIPAIPEGAPVPLLVTASSDGSTHVVNVRVDVAAIAKLMPQPRPR